MKRVILFLSLIFAQNFILQAMIINHHKNKNSLLIPPDMVHKISSYVSRFFDIKSFALLNKHTVQKTEDFYCNIKDLYSKRLLAKKYCLDLMDDEQINTNFPKFTDQLKEIYIAHETSYKNCYFDTLKKMGCIIDEQDNNTIIHFQDKFFFLHNIDNQEELAQIISSNKHNHDYSILHFNEVDNFDENICNNLQENVFLAKDNEKYFFFKTMTQSIDQLNVSLFLFFSKRGTDLNMFDENGNTALHYACQNNNVEIAQLLLNHQNVDVNASSLTNKKILHYIDKNFANKYGNTALHIACQQGNTEIVQQLLNHPNIDVNTVNLIKNTALHCAYQNGNTEIVQLLLNHPDILTYMINCQGYTPSEYAHVKTDKLCEVL